MKKLSIFLSLILMYANAYASDFSASIDYLKKPNAGNNYDDGLAYNIGYQHDIYKDLKGRAEFVHMTDIDFPTTSDVKGSFGELRGFGAMYNVIFELPYNKNVTFTLTGGVGPMFWDFRENPLFQDSNVKVDVYPSMVKRVSLGVDIEIQDNWYATFEGGWLDTRLGKRVTDANGNTMNLLDADESIGITYKTFRAGIRKEF